MDRAQIFTAVSRGCFPGLDMEWLHGDEDVWSVELEYRLKRAITFDPIVGRSQILTGVSRGCFPSGSYGISTG